MWRNQVSWRATSRLGRAFTWVPQTERGGTFMKSTLIALALVAVAGAAGAQTATPPSATPPARPPAVRKRRHGTPASGQFRHRYDARGQSAEDGHPGCERAVRCGT